MKAYRLHEFSGPESLRREELPSPTPGPGQVLVRVRAASLNYRDLMISRGVYNPKMPLPRIPLSDGAGEVVAAGPGASRFKPGDRVAANFMPAWIGGQLDETKARSALGGEVDGMLAEEVALPEDGLVRIPEHLSFEEAATLPCAALTAWHALVVSGGIKPGDTVLTQGTGGVSIFAIQFARLAGARVIATSSHDDKLERVKELGASDGINYKTTPDWDRRVRELTGGVGVDHVVEVGGAGTLREVDQGRPAGRPHRPDRRALGPGRGQPDADPDAQHPAPGHLRRLADHVRGDEPGHRREPAPPGHRPGLRVRRRRRRRSSTSRAGPISARS